MALSPVAILLPPCYFEFENKTLAYKECARDKPDDRTATCRNGKVLKLARWARTVTTHPARSVVFRLLFFRR